MEGSEAPCACGGLDGLHKVRDRKPLEGLEQARPGCRLRGHLDGWAWSADEPGLDPQRARPSQGSDVPQTDVGGPTTHTRAARRAGETGERKWVLATSEEERRKERTTVRGRGRGRAPAHPPPNHQPTRAGGREKKEF